MLYDIRLRITYSYDTPATASRTLLRMLPRSLPNQHLVLGNLRSEPEPSDRQDSHDFFGNPMTEIAHSQLLQDIAFVFEGRVRRELMAFTPDQSPSVADLAHSIAANRSIDATAPHHFLGASPRAPMEAEIAAFARDTVNSAQSVFDAIQAISQRIHDEFAFDASATDVSTPPIDAFLARRGVCQDITHVAITALRALGIPAGYVSGFLRTEPPEGQKRLEGADAMHAWLRAWCGPQTGWIETDPTNAVDVGIDHVTVAYGRDYADVAPVKGSLRSQGSHQTAQQVDMIPVVET